MENQQYTLLLNDSLKKHILGLSKKEKERLREKFEFLEAGIWDSGVRVKKLKGASRKVVFEGRLSKADRVIFTLGKKGSRTAIYIWGLVAHDDVKSKARDIFPVNAPFLNFEPEAREDYPEVLIEELHPDYYSQESVEERSPEDYGPQRWLVLSGEDWKRVLMASDPDNFEIFLFLTTEQSRILDTEPPLLLSGTAGSGKTTISVYYLLRNEVVNKKRLFLTFSPYLKDFSQRIYSGLVAKTGLEDAIVAPNFYVFRDLLWELIGSSGVHYDRGKEVGLREFQGIFRNHRLHQKYDVELVWEEIRSIIKGAKPPITIDRLRKLSQAYVQNSIGQEDMNELKDSLLWLKTLELNDKIEGFMQKKTKYTRMEDFVRSFGNQDGLLRDQNSSILMEILKILEKRTKSFSTPLLTYQEYLNLGKKRAPNFMYERRDIYDIAEYYQAQLEEKGLWDEIDLCRRAIQCMNRNQETRFKYDLIVCDEVQDFADIQLSLIFRLAKSPKGIVLTGDPKQIINPSGFRWEEVRNRFYERGIEIPEVRQLNLNFRCVGSIVRLSNTLLDLKQQLVGLSGSELREEWKFSGRPPFLLTGMAEKEILARLHMKGAGRIILVRDNHERERLKRAIGTELVFTISDAKGLEFDTVFLWKFSTDKKSGDLWRRIKCGDLFDRSHQPHLRHEINLLYVAVTRARNSLIIFDPQEDLWDLPALREHLYRTREKDVLSEIWQRVSTPEEWEKQGDYFFQREYYPAAAECYKNAGKADRAELARAYVFRDKRHFRQAAELFVRHGHHEEAAICFENAGMFGDALALWQKLRDKERATSCRIRLYEQTGQYDKAADEWMKLGEKTRALENWKKAGNHRKIGDHYESVRDYAKAAEAYEAAGEYARSAVCYKKIKRIDRAADLFYQAGDLARAIPLYKKLKKTSQLLDCYLGSKDYYNAALLSERQKEFLKAVDYFKAFAKDSPENRELLNEEARRSEGTRRSLGSAIRFSALGLHERSAPVFFKKRLYNLALADYEACGNHEEVASCYMAVRDYYKAALSYENSNMANKWDRVETLLEQYLGSSFYDGVPRGKQLLKEADSFAKQGAYERAIVRYKAVDSPEKVYDIYLKVGPDEEALRYFLSAGHYGNANQYLRDKKDLSVSADFVRSLVFGYRGSDNWRPGRSAQRDFISGLMLTLLQDSDGQEIAELGRSFLSSLSAYLDLHDVQSGPLLDLMVEVRHYNALMEWLRARAYLKGKSKIGIKTFMAALERKAKKENDEGLLACLYYVENRSAFEATLQNLDVTKLNYKVFAESRDHYQKAVDFLLGEQEPGEAAQICLRHRDYRVAAQVYENSGGLEYAAREYLNGKLYEDALRCYKKIGDEVGVARTLEKMMELDKALAIWRKLGRKRDAGRVLKKREKFLGKKSQLEFFR